MLKPIKDRIFIKTIERKITPPLLLPNPEFSPLMYGIVESIGPDVKEVKPGNKVYFHPFDELSGPENIVVIRESSLLAVVTDDENETE